MIIICSLYHFDQMMYYNSLLVYKKKDSLKFKRLK